jgi:hypothetical protein
MQIKITIRYHFTLTRMAIIRMTDNNECHWECEEIRTIIHVWLRKKNEAATLGKHFDNSSKCSTVTIWPSHSTLRHLLKISESIHLHKDLWWMFMAILFIITKRWEQPKCPLLFEWINKMWHIYAIECH